MDIWQIVVIVVLAALILVWVAVIAYNKGRVSGRLAAEQDLSGDEDTHSLFGDDAPVRPTERRLIEVLPEALIVTDRNGLVQYSSPGSVPFGLVSGDRLNSREVEDILTQAAADGGMREREVQLPINRNSYPSSNGRGLEAGQSRPSNTLYLRVRIGDIGDDLYAIFINDMSEQRRFEAVRRDFVTNVSHELKTPAGAIALLAETVTDAADDPDAVRYFSGRISKESARLTELVHHLIDLQKAQSPQSVIDARRISALDVARAAIAANQTQADSRHVDIRLSVNGQSVPTKVEELADGEGSLEESGSPATNGPMIDLYHLRDDGIMTIVLPHGVLFRGGEEGTIRRNLVENHHIQAIIGLPANIFFGTGIPTIVMVLRKHRNDDHVLVVDASKYFAKDGKNNKLRASDIKRIVDTVSENRDVDKFSRLVSLDEIRQNDYNLNIPRYVDSSETAESWDVYSTMFGGIPKQDIDALNKYWNVFPGLRQRLFAEENGHSAKLAVQDVREAVNADSGVSAYIQRYREVFTDYPSYLRGELVGNAVNVSIAAEEEVLANDLLHRLADVPLVDAYTAYQVLDDSWQKTIANDLETIQSEGHDAVRKVDANMVVKKKSGKDVEVQDGWAGHILPFDLVQEKLLSADLAEIGTYESRLTEISSEIADILENLDEDDKNSTDAVSEDGDSFVATELKKAVKSIGRDRSAPRR